MIDALLFAISVPKPRYHHEIHKYGLTSRVHLFLSHRQQDDYVLAKELHRQRPWTETKQRGR